MDKEEEKIEKFRQQRIARIKAMREEEKEQRKQSADQANRIKAEFESRLIQYNEDLEKYERVKQELNELAFDMEIQQEPNAQDAALFEVMTCGERAQINSEKLEKAERKCRELYKEEVEQIKQLKMIEADQKEREKQRKLQIQEENDNLSKIAVQKQRIYEQEREAYLLEEELANQTEDALIRKAEGAKYCCIEKHPQIPLYKETKTHPSLQIVQEFHPCEEDSFVEEDAYIAAANKLEFEKNEVTESKHFDVKKHLEQTQLSTKAKEALNILEMIKKM